MTKRIAASIFHMVVILFMSASLIWITKENDRLRAQLQRNQLVGPLFGGTSTQTPYDELNPFSFPADLRRKRFMMKA